MARPPASGDPLAEVHQGRNVVVIGALRAYLREAMGYAQAGIKPAKEKHALELPPELSEALAADPELAQGYYRLAPGRQRSCVIHLTSAKKPETRLSRMAGYRALILAERGAMER